MVERCWLEFVLFRRCLGVWLRFLVSVILGVCGLLCFGGYFCLHFMCFWFLPSGFGSFGVLVGWWVCRVLGGWV